MSDTSSTPPRERLANSATRCRVLLGRVGVHRDQRQLGEGVHRIADSSPVGQTCSRPWLVLTLMRRIRRAGGDFGHVPGPGWGRLLCERSISRTTRAGAEVPPAGGHSILDSTPEVRPALDVRTRGYPVFMAHHSRISKVLIDVTPTDHDRELAFWQAVVGGRWPQPTLPEYHGVDLPGEDFELHGSAAR